MAEPGQFTNEQDVLLSVGPFGGLDLTTSPYHIAPNMASAMSNVVPNRAYKAYCTAQGRVANFFNGTAVDSQNLPLNINALYCINSSPLGVNAGDQTQGYIIGSTINGTFAASVQTSTILSLWPPATSLPVLLTPPAGTSILQTFGPSPQPGNIIQGSDGFGYINMAGSGALRLLSSTYYYELLLNRWGLEAPAVAPTVAAGAGTNLTGTYYYAYTYTDNTQESGPSPFSAAITVTNQGIVISGMTAPPAGSSINLYRMGGTIGGVPLQVASGILGTTYTDNLADAAITGAQLILTANTPLDLFPSSGINCCTFWKGRMWIGGGGQARATYLCYSNYELLSVFNQLSQTVDIGGAPNAPVSAPFGVTDVAINLLPVGPYLLVLKAESTWVVTGNTGADFVSQNISDVGCCSRGSAAEGYGLAFWLSEDGVQMFNNGGVTNISDATIRSFLETWFANVPPTTVFAGANASVSYLSSPVGWVNNRVYYLSFPQQNVTFGYDLNTQQWFQLSQSTTAVYSQKSPFNLYSAYPTRGIFAANAALPGTVDLWNAAETDYGLSIASSWTSGVTDSGAPTATKQYRFVTLTAPVQAGASCTITVTPDPGSSITPFTTPSINLGSGSPFHIFSLPPGMSGTQVQLKINVTSSQKVTIDRATVLGYIKRKNIKTGTI